MRSHLSDKKPRRLAKLAITGVLVAVPMTVVAAPAAADPAPGIVQVDRGWNDKRHDRDCFLWDRQRCNDWDRREWERREWERREWERREWERRDWERRNDQWRGPGNFLNGFFPGGGLFGSS